MIFFGRYGHVEDIKTDKKILLGHFNSLNHSLDYDDKKEYNKYLKICRSGKFLGYNGFRRNKEEYMKQIKREYKILNS